jgi:riboflavin kinase/FMN adenylyltransferase
MFFAAAFHSDMQIIRNRPERKDPAGVPEGSAVAIGNFDAVHRGHRSLIERCRQLAGRRHAVAVVSFEPLPQAFFRPDDPPPRLTTVYRKLELLRGLGVDLTWLMRFDASLAALSARDFVRQVLVERLNARYVVVGADFRYGRGREGDVALLRQLGEEFGFEAVTVPAVMCNGDRISSTGIRRLLAAGEFAPAADQLGRPFRMEGHVVRGAGLGRKLGYPTANLRVRSQPSPLGGVLAAFSSIAGGPWLPAVTNLGRRPVVGGRETLLEVHFFDFDRDIYGQRLDVQFVAKLRDEENFDSIDDLVARMKQDERQARAILAKVRPPE